MERVTLKLFLQKWIEVASAANTQVVLKWTSCTHVYNYIFMLFVPSSLFEGVCVCVGGGVGGRVYDLMI